VDAFDTVFGLAGQSLQAFLQQEDANEVACGGRLRQPGDAAGFELESLVDVAAAALPGVDQGEGRGIVFLAYLGGGLLAHHRRDDLPRQPCIGGPGAGSLRERPWCRAANEVPCLGKEFFRLGQAIDQADGFRAPGIEGFAGEHRLQGLGRTDQSWQAGAATPAGKDAKHHFGQADFRGVVVGGDAVAAGQRQFRATAHAGAVDGGDGRAGQAREVFVDALAVFDVFLHRASLGVGDEFLDVGTHGEA